MVKPVSSEISLNNQFSEISSNSVKPKQSFEPIKSTENTDKEVFQGEKIAHSDNEALKNLQDVQAQKTEEEAAEEIDKALVEVSEFMSMYNRNVNFSMDEKSEKTIIKVFDSDSRELIKQFPSEDLVKLAQKIRELKQDVDLKSGIFLDEKV